MSDKIRELPVVDDWQKRNMVKLLNDILQGVEDEQIRALQVVIMTDECITRSWAEGRANRLEHLGMLEIARAGLLDNDDPRFGGTEG